MTSATTLADIAVTRPAAAHIFYRLGLDFRCGGRQSLAQACAVRGIDPDAVMADIDAEERATVTDDRWDLQPLPSLIDLIVNTYHRRLRETLPDLVRMAQKVEIRHGEKPECPRGLAAHLAHVHEAVLDHLAKEEQVLFPLIRAGQGRIAIGPVHVLETEHEEHGRDLATMRRLTGDLEAPAAACPTWRALYLGLREFEQELMLHIHLENNVLFRRALAE